MVTLHSPIDLPGAGVCTDRMAEGRLQVFEVVSLTYECIWRVSHTLARFHASVVKRVGVSPAQGGKAQVGGCVEFLMEKRRRPRSSLPCSRPRCAVGGFATISSMRLCQTRGKRARGKRMWNSGNFLPGSDDFFLTTRHRTSLSPDHQYLSRRHEGLLPPDRRRRLRGVDLRRLHMVVLPELR